MSIMEHLRELRTRFFVSSIVLLIFSVVAFAFYNYFAGFLIGFYSSIESIGETSLYVNSIVEGITTKISISIILGLIFSTPVHIFNIVSFIFPSLKAREKKYIIIALICSFVLIVLSIYLSYFKILPISISFLTNGGFIPSDVGILLNYNTGITYVLYFVLWSVLAFQTPIVFEFLMIFNIIKRKTALKMSRYIIVVIFVAAAIVTPPDVMSQIGLALPLTVMFFLAILIAKIFKFGE